MRPRALWISLVFLLLFSLISLPIAAQTETVRFTTYDGLLSFALPTGWVVDTEADASGAGFFSVASSQRALRVIINNGRQQSTNDPLPAGEIGFLALRWPYLVDVFDLGQPGTAPVDVLQRMFGEQLADLSVALEPTTVGEYPAVTFFAADERSAGAFYALDLGVGGTLVLAFSAASEADYAAWESTLLDLMASIDVGGDAVVHYLPSGVFSQRWSPDSQTYALVARYPLGEQPLSAALYNRAGVQLAEVAGLGVSWNSDGSQAALFGDARSSAVPIIDTATGKVLFTLGTGAGLVRWSPDDRFIVAGDLRQALRIWDAATGQQLASLDPAQTWAFSPDGTRLAAWDVAGSTVRMIDLNTASELWTAERASQFFTTIPEVSWSPDGALLFTVAPDGTPTLLDSATGSVSASFPPSAGMEFTSPLWRTAGLVLIYRNAECRTGDCRSEVVALDKNGVERARITQSDAVTAVIWNADGSQVVTATSFEALTVTAWDVATGAALWTTTLDGALSTFINPRWVDDHLLIETRSERTPLLDAATGEVIAVNEHGGRIRDVLLNADQSRMLVVGSSLVRVRAVDDGALLMTLPHTLEVIEAAWSADETLIFTTTEGGTFTVWDAETGRLLTRIDDRSSVVASNVSLFAAVSPDGQQVSTYLSGSPYARVWSVASRVDEARARIAAETQTVEDFLDASDAAFDAQDYEAMIAACLNGLDVDPDNLIVHNSLAVAYYLSGELTRAVDTLHAAIAIDPAYVRSYRNLGDMYRRENSLPAARSAYEDGLNASTTDVDRAFFNNRIGLTYSSSEDYAEAAQYFTWALELDPTVPIYFRNRGYMNYRQGEAFYPQAIADFERFVELAGADADAETVDLLATLRGD